MVDSWVRGGLAEALPATGTDPGPEGVGWSLCRWDTHPVRHGGQGPREAVGWERDPASLTLQRPSPPWGAPPAAPTALCLLQQLPARGGAHAGARPRRGGLLPAVRVQVRGAEHHHHQGARRPAQPRPLRGPAPSPWGPCAGPAPPRPPPLSCFLLQGSSGLWGWTQAGRVTAQGPPSHPALEPLSPLTPSHSQGGPGTGAGDPFPDASCLPLLSRLPFVQ